MKNRLIFLGIVLFALLVRIWGLDKVPVSLFGDELDVGYHAYSIINTGRDYMGNFLPMHFRSLAESRTPLYIYSSVPTVALFGISPLGVRLPAVLFGVLGVIFTYLLIFEMTKQKNLSLIAMIVVTLSPWHIHYSRAGFEVTLLYALLSLGLVLFLKSFNNPKLMIFSVISLGLTPWVYSTAKLYLPMVLAFLLIGWWRDIFKLPKKFLYISFVVLLIIIIPYSFNTLKGGGVDRFNLISIFNDQSMEIVVGGDRNRDLLVAPLSTRFSQDKVFHNKYAFWEKAFLGNYLKVFSTDFLFISGDGNARHKSTGAGVLYSFESILLLCGGYFLIAKNIMSRKMKFLVLFLLFSSPIPSSLTVGGGNHASRLFFMILPLAVLVSVGITELFGRLKNNTKRIYIYLMVIIYALGFYGYQHYYWVHYPWDSERMWNSGWQGTVREIVKRADKYNQVIVSTYKDASLIYFLSWGAYPPELFQKQIKNKKVEVKGFGECKEFGKFKFPEIGSSADLYEMGKVLDDSTLYIVPFEQIKFDLAREPERIPGDVGLVFTSNFASGAPAFYAFEKNR